MQSRFYCGEGPSAVTRVDRSCQAAGEQFGKNGNPHPDGVDELRLPLPRGRGRVARPGADAKRLRDVDRKGRSDAAEPAIADSLTPTRRHSR
jgi:hypothetical protein